MSLEELRALQNEKLGHEKTIEKPPLEEIFKEEIEAAKTKAKNKIGF